VQGEQAAAKTLSALEAEREDPGGEPAFGAPRPLLPLCGPLSMEVVCGLMALVGLRGLGRSTG